jgi:hypothetical protein
MGKLDAKDVFANEEDSLFLCLPWLSSVFGRREISDFMLFLFMFYMMFSTCLFVSRWKKTKKSIDSITDERMQSVSLYPLLMEWSERARKKFESLTTSWEEATDHSCRWSCSATTKTKKKLSPFSSRVTHCSRDRHWRSHDVSSERVLLLLLLFFAV